MQKALMIIAAGTSLCTLAGCASDQYGYGYGNYGYGTNSGYDYGYAAPYNAYYDGYYGPIYDGYWGTNGTFYYRTSRDERAYRAGNHAHFRRDRGDGDHWREWRGSVTPQRGYKMPHYRHTNHNGDHDRGRHRGRHDHD